MQEKKKQIKNLLHQGRGVQEGREVQAIQAGRAYHRYQGDQEDPTIGGGQKKKRPLNELIAGVWC